MFTNSCLRIGSIGDKKLILLKKNNGKTLVLFGNIEGYSKISTEEMFFELSTENKFHTIIGNFCSDVLDKCLNHLYDSGEIIFRTSETFLKSPLCRKINQTGTITDIISQENGIICRYEKNDLSHKTLFDGKWLNSNIINNKMLFLEDDYCIPFTDVFSIRSGATSGNDEIFTSRYGNAKFVTSETLTSGKLKKMFFNHKHKILAPYKKRLLKRTGKKFTDENWWMWEKSHFISDEPRIYVPCNTQLKHPFFNGNSINYLDSVLALFPKVKMTLKHAVSLLNKLNWDAFRSGKQLTFTQKSLESMFLPKSFQLY